MCGIDQLLSMGKQKFYVVWEGVTPGIYTSWTECQLQIKGYDGAKFKSFDTREEAEHAIATSPYVYIGKNAKKNLKTKRKIQRFYLLQLSIIAWLLMQLAVVIPVLWNIVEYT